MEQAEILYARLGRMGLITLNRPAALNALSHSMCRMLHRALMEAAADPAVERVVVEGAGDRAFCAGGDVVALREATVAAPAFEGYFRDEYRLDQAVARFPKPYVALIDGVTMGGGVGISIHAPFRVATERTLFAMPEAAIGFMTDVGATHALPRLAGETGTWIGLTGARLRPADCRAAGIATHHVPAAELPLIKERLADSPLPVDQILATFDSDPGPSDLESLRDGIDYHFGHDSVEAILASLDGGDDWAAGQAAALRSFSPTSLKLILHGLRAGAADTLEDCLRREFRIAARMRLAHDFSEGVRAQLVDKDRRPRWQPATLAEVDIAPYLAEPDSGDLRFD
jgi:enoyl-CoA hydratase